MSIDKEIESFWRFIKSSIDRILLCTNELSEAELNWRPLDNANSLYVLAIHTIGNTEENILGVLCGQKITRRREDEFKARGKSVGPLHKRWQEVQERISSYLGQLSPDALEKEYEHPRRGKLTGRDVLIVVARHAAEHMGQAELTRDLLHSKRVKALPPQKRK
jgi:uncharacterized damage-inducible protein DinB